MSFLEQIVEQINAGLELRKMYGISQPVKRTKEGGFDVIPGVLKNGEWLYPGVDDSESEIVYHKLYGNSYTVDSKTGYGDSNGLIKCTSDMSMVVYANKSKCSRHELEQKVNNRLIQTIPLTILRDLLLNSVIINATSSNMDMQTVWANEYKNVPYPLTEDDILFELKYKVETVYKKECQPC